MNELQTNMIENRTDRRRIGILKHLYYDTTNIKVVALANTLKIDKKTLTQDIEVLQDQYDTPVKLSENKKYVHTKKGSHERLTATMKEIFSESISYHLIEHIFNEKHRSAQHWAEYFHISYIHFRRHLRYINQKLEPFHISIGSKKVTLIGKEDDIQHFFREYFSDQDIVSDQNLIQFSYRMYENFMKNMEKEGLKPLSLDHHNLVFMFQIMMHRLRNKHQIHIDQNIMDANNSKKSYIAFKKVYLDIWSCESKQLQDSLAIEEGTMLYCYLTTLQCVDFTSIPKHTLSFMREDVDTEQLSVYLDFAHNSLLKLNLSQDNLEYATETVQAFLVNLTQLSELSTLFQRLSGDVKHLIKDENTLLYLFWKEQCTKLKLLGNIQIDYLEDVAISLTMLTFPYISCANLLTTKVYACFSGETSYLSYLNYVINYKFLPSIELVHIPSSKLSNKFLKENDVQILLTNFKINKEITKAEHFMFSYIPSNDEIKEVLQRVNEWRQQALQNMS